MICLQETHLNGDQTVELQGYTWFGHNRDVKHRYAKRNFGGVGVLIKSWIFNEYDVETLDRSIDGILAIKLTNKHTDYEILLICAYLPPENSNWGRDASGFYAHILSLLYLNYDCDSVLITGDLNSRIGDAVDYIPDIDMISQRKPLERRTDKNKHGSNLLELLIDAKLCVVNGRISPEFDNFTCISTKGKSVVDYFIVPHMNLINCVKCTVHTVKDIIDPAYHGNVSLPDHSLLELVYIPRDPVNVNVNTPRSVTGTDHVPASADSSLDSSLPLGSRDSQSADRPTDLGNLASLRPARGSADPPARLRRYNVRDGMPDDFLQSDLRRSAIVEAITRLETIQNNQIDIDSTYKDFCDIYHDELNTHLNYKDMTPQSAKRFRRSVKPYWNAEVQSLWNIYHEAERQYLKCKDKDRRRLKEQYNKAQNDFDKAFRKAKRKFNREKTQEIEHLETDNPKKFWEAIKRLGPQKKNDIPMEVYDDDGNIVTDSEYVLNKWKTEYEKLFTSDPNIGDYDSEFYNDIIRSKTEIEENSQLGADEWYNTEISLREVWKVITAAKLGKATGIDNIPNEALKNEVSVNYLHKLFNKMFYTGMIPSLWRTAILKPIPKGSTSDRRLPLQYRGISLLSTVSKLYTAILNNRCVTHMNSTDRYADEQNGFRQDRSCLDHIYSLTSVIRNRKAMGLSTFVVYIDAEKAFDRIDRELMLYKLLSNGIYGRLYQAIKCIYSSSSNIINLNGFLTEHFASTYGVKQGDCLSPTLFGIYVNDLMAELNSVNRGVQVGNRILNCLIYADDLALIGGTEEDIQAMLDTVHSWCTRWRIKINCAKSQVVHYRRSSIARSEFEFNLGTNVLEIVEQYKYLGVILHEHLDYAVTSGTLAGAAGRALGSIISKHKHIKGLAYSTYQTMYQSCVTPILDYASGVWGYGVHSKVDTVQNRAIRVFLGVHSFAPNLSINGDVAWTPCIIRRKIEILRFWNRLQLLDNNRLTKQIFLWDKNNRSRCKNWSNDVYKIMQELDESSTFENNELISLNCARGKLYEHFTRTWRGEVSVKPKLRTYKLFKDVYELEPYISINMSVKYRSVLARLRNGILPLELETGRYHGVPEAERICKLCDSGDIENEFHFLFKCSTYQDDRQQFFSYVVQIYPDFLQYDDINKLKSMMTTEVVLETAKFVYNCFQKRQSLIYV